MIIIMMIIIYTIIYNFIIRNIIFTASDSTLSSSSAAGLKSFLDVFDKKHCMEQTLNSPSLGYCCCRCV